jgi:S-adenosylmethionine-diacylgycerolhomoserine-N-methlytransferase
VFTRAASEVDANAVVSIETTTRMNRMYRLQRHIYDGTRKYYLLSRNQLVSELRPAAGATVLEIGSGTGRNLVQAARLYPAATFFGIDVSTEMLASASAAISRAGLDRQIHLRHGDATAFDSRALFGVSSFDHVMISYSLSMIPNWRRAVEAAADLVKDGGRLHIVDFGNQERLPKFVCALLRRWLAIFDVAPCEDLEGALNGLASSYGATLVFGRPFRGYAQYAVVTFPMRPCDRELGQFSTRSTSMAL